MPSDCECAYLAGFVDGEGTLTITRHTRKDRPGYKRFNLRLAVYNTNIGLLNTLRETWGGNLMTIDRRKELKNWKPQGQLCWSEGDMVRALEAILPYLKLKSEQARILLDMQDTKMQASSGRRKGISLETQEKRACAYIRLKELNRRGVGVAV